MLLSYGVKNFCCFKNWLEIDLSFNANVPDEISESFGAAKALCIKGANASGKTNALKVLSFLSFFCVSSFSQEPEDEIPVEPFFDSSEPSEFYVRFRIGEVDYIYELAVTKKEVVSEKIFKKEKRKVLILDRERLKTNKTLTSEKVNVSERKNASVISVAKQYVLKEFEPFYDFFKNIRTNVNFFGLRDDPWRRVNVSCKLYLENPSIFTLVKEYLLKFDTGISDIEIQVDKNAKASDIWYPVFYSTVDGALKKLEYRSQSRGTQILFDLLLIYFQSLENGSVLVLDEFDVYLHPDILPHLVKLFLEDTNKKNAQLIFSTHNNEIIDYMGKYRTVICNKVNGECFAYRLDEIKTGLLRNDRSILPIYKTGRLGGIPRI
ncbi:MAG: ATP-binding protein [Fibrobacter sp.]|nr:ATP-binding protein [Fibrobacter sp.]